CGKSPSKCASILALFCGAGVRHNGDRCSARVVAEKEILNARNTKNRIVYVQEDRKSSPSPRASISVVSLRRSRSTREDSLIRQARSLSTVPVIGVPSGS